MNSKARLPLVTLKSTARLRWPLLTVVKRDMTGTIIRRTATATNALTERRYPALASGQSNNFETNWRIKDPDCVAIEWRKTMAKQTVVFLFSDHSPLTVF